MKYLLLLLFLTSSFLVDAQTEKQRSWTLNGYIKYMGNYSISPELITSSERRYYDNLVHNRLNFKWYATKDLKIVAELRNRLFFGDEVRDNPFFSELRFSNLDDYWNWSKYWEDSAKVIAHVMLDRFYANYTLGNFEAKIGRQRINWGINMAWNPNDIFNAFSYFDFDYEERPGSDAVLLKYYTGIASSIEVAGKMADEFKDFTGALLWKINYWNYDFQILSGVSNENLVFGGGWAGNIKKAGFKGESSYFYPLENALDSSQALVSAISIEYSFTKLFVSTSVLYSSNGKQSPTALDQLLYYSGNISAKYLSPYTYSGLLQATYQFHPLVNGGIAIIGYPGNKDAFLNPYTTISLFQSLDLDIIAQLLFNDVNDQYSLTNQLYYGRLKYSF